MGFTLEQVNEKLNKYGLALKEQYMSSTKLNRELICSCGKFFTTRLNRAINGERILCKECISKIQTKTNEQFLFEVYEQVEEEYTFLEEYKGTKTKIKVLHNSCGYEYNISPDKFLNKKSRCPKCNGSLRKNLKVAKEELIEKGIDKFYEILSMEENNYMSKMQVKHLDCGNIFETTYRSLFYKNIQCPYCKTNSKGEKFILDLLKYNNINFKLQYILKDCKYITYLKFDFAIFDSNNILTYLLEYDGEGHYQSVNLWGGQANLEIVKKRDNIKDEYCFKNNIKLIRIPYYEFNNIETILKNHNIIN